jgi:hypothetical protein
MLSEPSKYSDSPAHATERFYNKIINAMDIRTGVIRNSFLKRPVILLFKFVNFMSCPILIKLQREQGSSLIIVFS